MADVKPLVINAGMVRQSATGDVIVVPGLKDSALSTGKIPVATTDGQLIDGPTDASASWNTAYGWGNWAHTTLSGYGITDAVPSSFKTTLDALTGIMVCSGAGVYSAITDNHSYWNSAYGWGDWHHTTLSGYGITDACPLTHKTTEDALNGLVKCDGAGGYSAVTDNTRPSLTNNSGAVVIPICTPVYIVTADKIAPAKADAVGTVKVVALATAAIAVSAAGICQIEGILVATTGQWDAVTGGSGGLTAGSVYYLSAATAGGITTTAPTTGYVAQIGIALSTTELNIQIKQPIKLSTATAGQGGISWNSCPIGSIIAWLKTYTNTPQTLPVGWYECDGSVLSDAGSVYNGLTLPNLNGNNYFLRGASTSGGTGGEDTHALSVAELAAHAHNIVTESGGSGSSCIVGGSFNSSTRNINTDSTGSGAAHENKPPYYNVVWIMRIK
jgi:hypothetical protein